MTVAPEPALEAHGPSALREHGGDVAVCYRIGEAFLEVVSDNGPLLDALDLHYRECQVPRSAPGAPRVRCQATLLPEHLLLLHFEGHPIPQFVDVARRLFWSIRALQCYVEAPCPLPGWRMVVKGEGDGRPLVMSSADAALVDLWEAPPDFLIDCLFDVMRSVQPAVLFLHGASMSVHGSGVLLVGSSKKGKSTTALSLASRGHPFLGDDVAAIRLPQRELLGIRRSAALRDGALPQTVRQRLARCGYAQRTDPDGTIRKLVRVGDLFPSPPPQPVRLDVAFFLNGFADTPRVTPYRPSLDDLDRLHELMASYRPTPGRQLMKFLKVLDVLSSVRCYVLDVGAPEDTAATIEGVMA